VSASVTRAAIEWPTVLLIALLYAAWAGLTWFHDALPAWAWVVLAGIVGTWWGSVQHEAIHGHPTRWQRLNTALATPPFCLWLPFRRYRHSHLAHHRDERLTDPLDDPESRYWTPAQWQALSPIARVLVAAQATLLGRLLIGPFWSIARYWRAEWRFIRGGNRKVARIWAWHALWVALVLAWAIGVCGVPPWQYVLGFVVLATSLTLIRSFAEHRAAEAVEHRTAIVERGGVLGLLFLFNNLHVVHHALPRVPWYQLPAEFAARREEWVRLNGGLVYAGYGELFRKFLLRPHDAPLHPNPGRQAGER
jgi:fatty acid desaturase